MIFEEALKLERPVPGLFFVLFLCLSMVLLIMAGGLRLPFFVFWSKNTADPEPLRKLPGNMVLAMVMTGTLCLVQGVFPEVLNRFVSYPAKAFSLTSLKLGVGFMVPAATVLLFVFLKPLLKPGRNELPDFEKIYAWVARGVILVLSRPLSWMDGYWSEIYRAIFLRAYHFMARISDVF